MKRFFIILLITLAFGVCFVFGAYYIISHNVISTENTLNTSIEPENIVENTTNHIDETQTNEITNKMNTSIIASSQLKEQNTVTPPNILENGFELPIDGASGYASISLKVYNKASTSGEVIKTLNPGTGFQIIQEQGDWWQILVSNKKGWIQNEYCMINLPDVLPSIIYDDTNSYSSIFMSSGKKLPNITGKALYNVYTNNERLDKKEFIMPIMYATAKRIAKAQQLALANNQSLKIYETFRPYQTQKNVASSLTQLINSDKTVKNGIYTNGWNKSWFIAQVLSNHQRGIALDVSLVDIEKSKYIKIGNYTCLEITEYEECEMPTKMHELSAKAVTFKYGVDTQSKTAWKNVPYAESMTTSAKTLQNYFTKSGMYPISSEWWHFNDLETKESIGKNYSNGQYYITKCYSTIPK